MSDDEVLQTVRRPLRLHAQRLARLVQGAWACWTVEDLMQEGALAALEAWRRFEPSRGVPFTTYAEARIRGAMWDYIRRNRPGKRRGLTLMRVPLHLLHPDDAALHAPREAGYAQVEACQTVRALRHVPYVASSLDLLLRHLGWEEELAPLARAMGITTNAMRNRLQRCLRRLQAAVAEDTLTSSLV